MNDDYRDVKLNDLDLSEKEMAEMVEGARRFFQLALDLPDDADPKKESHASTH